MTRTLFNGGDVFDAVGEGPEPKPADVVVEDGRIVAVGPGLDGDASVDCRGRTLLPGLFDCHTHIMASHFDLWRMVQTPFSLQFFEAARNLEATLAAGITTVRDAGGADLGVKTAVEQGLTLGPRMQISLVMLSQTGGHADEWMVCGGDLPYPFVLPHPGRPSAVVDGPEEMRKKVRELVRAGADVIKVATSGGVLSRSNPHHANFRIDELDALMAEATAAARPVMAHAQSAAAVKAAVRAGVRSIEHGVYLDDEAIDMMLERGTYLVPTLLASHGLLEAAAAGKLTDESRVKAEMAMEAHGDSVARAIAAGVKVAMGTDSGVTPHGQNLRELALLAGHGMSATETLVAASRTAAELMGLDRELGTLEPGKRADLVVVDGTPLDVETLPGRIAEVYKDAELVAKRVEGSLSVLTRGPGCSYSGDPDNWY